jgi:hypothetical protein
MAWGVYIPGLQPWPGLLSAENLSFERPDAGGAQGEADLWDVDSSSEQEGIAALEDLGSSWEPWEDFEEKWQAPLLVHVAQDLVNQPVSPDATDLPSAITLANELAAKYPAHLRTVDRAASLENGADEPWAISDGDTLTLKVNRGEEQTVTLSGLTPGAATAEQVAQSINQQLYEARATVTSAGLRVTLATIRRGRSAFLEITGGTANVQMLFSTTEREGTDNVHLEADIDNMVSFGPDPALDYITLAVVVMALKEGYNGHVWEFPTVHKKWDKANTVTSPDVALDPPNPAELPQLIVLLNELKTDFSHHLVLQGYGDYNEDSKFVFSASDLAAAIFDPNLGSEGYERAWALRDLYPDLMDQRDHVSMDGYVVVLLTVLGIPSDTETFSITFASATYTFEFDDNGAYTMGNVQVDISGALSAEDVRDAMLAAINGAVAPAYAANAEGTEQLIVYFRSATPQWDEDFPISAVNLGTAAASLEKSQWGASWPGGHMELLSVFEYIGSECGIMEHFEDSWLLPGSLPDWPNEKFVSRYLGADGVFRFTTGQLVLGISEDFETYWKDNHEGVVKYWSGTAWRFDYTVQPTQLEAASFGTTYYEYGSVDMTNPAVPDLNPGLPGYPPQYSPSLRVRVTLGYTGAFGLSITLAVTTIDFGAQSIDVYLSGTLVAGEIYAVDINQKCLGLRALTGITVSPPYTVGPGEFLFEGPEKAIEVFDQSEWTLVLT